MLLMFVERCLTHVAFTNVRYKLIKLAGKRLDIIQMRVQMEQHLQHRVIVKRQATQTAFIITEKFYRFHNHMIKSVCDYESGFSIACQ